MKALKIKISKRQKALARKHGTPSEFAAACYAAVPAWISMDEAAAAIAKYGRQWETAGGEPKGLAMRS